VKKVKKWRIKKWALSLLKKSTKNWLDNHVDSGFISTCHEFCSYGNRVGY